jgi:hypothetical protein
MGDHNQRSPSTDAVSSGYSPTTQTGNLFERPGLWAPRGVFLARVQRVSLEKGTHVVECVASSGGPGRPFSAIITTPFVTPEGRGIVAGIRKNTLCLCTASKGSTGSRFFVIGFYNENPGQWAKKDVQGGDIYLINEGDGYFASLANGDLEARATDTLWTAWSAEDEAIDSSARTRTDTSYAGTERWDHWRKAEGDFRAGDTKRTVAIRRTVDSGTKEVTYLEAQGRVQRPIGTNQKTEVVAVREVIDTSGKMLLREVFEEGGAVNVETADGVRLRLDGADVFIEPGDGGKVYINDPDKMAQKAARVGDSTEGHSHTLIIGTGAMGLVKSVTMLDATDKIKEGSDAVRIG